MSLLHSLAIERGLLLIIGILAVYDLETSCSIWIFEHRRIADVLRIVAAAHLGPSVTDEFK